MDELELKIRGLFLSPNDYSSVPQGALLEATNGVLDKDSVFDARRGQTFYSTAPFTDPVDKFFNFNGSILAHADDKLYYDDGLGVFTAYSGTYDQPAPTYRVRGIESNRNFYLTTNVGVKKLTSVTSTPTNAGAPPGLDVTGSLNGSSGFMANNTGVAYRMLWGYKDANNNLILGAPSQRFTIENTSGGTRNVSLTFTIPSGITTAWFYQIYRSLEVASGIEPNDELFLAVENNPTSGELTAGLVTVVDQTPETLLGPTLYTSPSQQGIENANLPPPLCKDMVLFNNMTLYANTISKNRLFLTLIGSGGSAVRFVATTGNTNSNTTLNGLGTTTGVRVGMRVRGTGIPVNAKVASVDSGSQVTLTVAATATATGVTIEFQDVLTIGNIEWYASAAQNIANREFQVFTAGTAAENIEDTALSLVTVVNRNTSNTAYYAFYVSGFNSLPGQMLFEERTLGGATFYATSTAGDSFNPTLPTTGTTVASDDNDLQNGIYVSKNDQPEAVPVYAFLLCGSANKPIRRILALRDSVFIFKDDGIFRFTGTDYASAVVSMFDGSKRLVAYESPAVFDNQVFAFLEDGVNAVSEQGVQLISKPIENVLLVLSQFSNFEANTFGVGYDSDRKYILWTIDTDIDTYAVTGYVWNAITGSWTIWDLPRTAGFVSDGDNKLYMADAVNDYVYQERKSFTFLDYADEAYPVTITNVSGREITLADASTAVVGYALKQGLRIVTIEEINGNVLTVNYELLFVNGAATIDKPFEVTLTFVPLTAKNPNIVKHFTECSYYFKEANFETIEAQWNSNNAEAESVILPIPESNNGAFGTLTFGTFPFGGGNATDGRFTIRTYFPLSSSRANWVIPTIKTNEPFVNMSLMGMSYKFNPMSSKLVAA
jgi:hypothetical protein